MSDADRMVLMHAQDHARLVVAEVIDDRLGEDAAGGIPRAQEQQVVGSIGPRRVWHQDSALHARFLRSGAREFDGVAAGTHDNSRPAWPRLQQFSVRNAISAFIRSKSAR